MAGGFLKRLYERLNEDSSRYRAKDARGNVIPFELYQSDDEHAVAILDPNGKAPKPRHYRRVHGWDYKLWRFEGSEEGNIVLPGTPTWSKYHLYDARDGGGRETLESRAREDVLQPRTEPEPEDKPPKVLPQFMPRPYDGMSPDEPDPAVQPVRRKKWTPYVAVNMSWKL